MHPYSIKVWYFCKECTISFKKLEDFFEHKNRIHFSELQNTKCIVFEERIKSEDPENVFSSSPANWTHNFEPQLQVEVVCDLQDSININDPDLNTEDTFKWELNENSHNDNIGDETDSLNLQSDFDFGAFCSVTINEDVKPAIFSSINTSIEETMETTTTGENIDQFSFDFEPQAQGQQIIYGNLIKIENESSEVLVGIDRRVKALQNPYIRLTRLTTTEIEQYKQSSAEQHSDDYSAFLKKEGEIPLPVPATTSANSYECQLCLKKLHSEPELKIHVGICALYHSDRSWFCVPCDRKFFNAQALKLHCHRFHETNKLMNESNKRSKPLPCRTQLTSTTTTQQKSAIKCSSTMQQGNGHTIKSYKLYKCEQCDYSSPRKHTVTTHKAHKHSSERPFKCSQPNCGLAFKSRDHLNRHGSCHSDEKPFQCNYPNCDSRFKRKSNLVDHEIRIHRS